MAEPGNDQALVATFAFGTVAIAAVASASLYLRGGTSPLIRDALRLVLIGYLTTSFLWALTGFIATFVRMSAASGCQTAVAFASLFDQLARVLLEQFIFWAMDSDISASLGVLLPQGVFLVRIILGAVFVGVQRPQFKPVCVGITSVTAVGILLLLLEAGIVAMLFIRAFMVGIFNDRQQNTAAWPRGRSLLFVTLALGLWIALSIPLFLALESFDLAVRTVLPAIGSLVAIILVAIFRKHLKNSSAAPSPAPQMTEYSARNLPPSIAGSATRGLQSRDITPSFYATMFEAPREVPRPDDDDDDERPIASRDGAAGLPIISRPSPGQADAGVGGVPVAGQLFPPVKEQAASPSAKGLNGKPINKVLLNGSQVTISNPVLINNDQGDPLQKVATVDLATAAREQKEWREKMNARASTSRLTGPTEALSAKEIRSQSQSLMRKEVGISVDSTTEGAKRLSRQSKENSATAETSSAQTSPTADQMRRRSPVSRTPRSPASNFAASPTQNRDAGSGAGPSSPLTVSGKPWSPGAQAQSPGAEAQSPGVEAQSPGAEAQSPGVEAQSPGVEAQSHGVEAQSPGIEAQSPGVEAQSPGVEAQSPGFDAQSPMTEKFPQTASPRRFDPKTPTAEQLSSPSVMPGNFAASKESTQAPVLLVSSRGPGKPPEPSNRDTASQGFARGALASIPRGGPVRADIRPSRQRRVSPPLNEQPEAPKKLVQLRKNNGIPSNPRARLGPKTAPQKPAESNKSPEKELSDTVPDQAPKDVAEEASRARSQRRESILDRPRPVTRSVGYVSPTRRPSGQLESIDGRLSNFTETESSESRNISSQLSVKPSVPDVQGPSPAAIKGEQSPEQVSQPAPDVSPKVLSPQQKQEAYFMEPFRQAETPAGDSAREVPAHDSYSSDDFVPKPSRDAASGAFDERQIVQEEAGVTEYSAPRISGDMPPISLAAQAWDAEKGPSRLQLPGFTAESPATHPEPSTAKSETREWLQPNDRRRMVESAYLTDDDDDSKETMTVMLQLPAEAEQAESGRASWHRRVGEKCPTFSDRKRMTKTRLVPRPPPLPLDKPTKTRTITAGLPTLESPQQALEKIQEQLDRLGELVEPPATVADQPQRPRLQENMQRGTSLLAELETEMGMQEDRWQEMRRDYSRASMSTLASSPMSGPSSAKLERTLSAAMSTEGQDDDGRQEMGQDDPQTSMPTLASSPKIGPSSAKLERRLSTATDVEVEDDGGEEIGHNYSRASISTTASSPRIGPSSVNLEHRLLSDSLAIEASDDLAAAALDLDDSGNRFGSPSELEKWALGGGESLMSIQAPEASSAKSPALISPTLSSPDVRAYRSSSVYDSSNRNTDAAIQLLLPGQSSAPDSLQRPVTRRASEAVEVETPMPAVVKERPRTIKPPRRSKRMSSLPDILENPVPMNNKRNTMGIFQFAWGEMSDSGSLPLSSQMRDAMKMNMGMDAALNMTPGMPPSFPSLDAQARSLSPKAYHYPSSVFEDYEYADEAAEDDYGINSDDERFGEDYQVEDDEGDDEGDDDEGEDDEDEDDDDDSLDEATLWDIANLLKSDKVPSRGSLFPSQGMGSQQEPSSGASRYYDSNLVVEHRDSGPPAESSRDFSVEEASSQYQSEQVHTGGGESRHTTMSFVGLPQPEETFETYQTLPSDTARAPLRSSQIDSLASGTLRPAASDESMSAPTATVTGQTTAMTMAPRDLRPIDTVDLKEQETVAETLPLCLNTPRQLQPKLVELVVDDSARPDRTEEEPCHAPESALVDDVLQEEARFPAVDELSRASRPPSTIDAGATAMMDTIGCDIHELWTPPAVTETVEPTGLFRVPRVCEKDLMMSTEPAALTMRPSSTTRPQILERLEPTGLWTPPKHILAQDWISLSSTAPSTPGTVSSARSSQSPFTDASSIHTSITGLSTANGSLFAVCLEDKDSLYSGQSVSGDDDSAGQDQAQPTPRPEPAPQADWDTAPDDDDAAGSASSAASDPTPSEETGDSAPSGGGFDASTIHPVFLTSDFDTSAGNVHPAALGY